MLLNGLWVQCQFTLNRNLQIQKKIVEALFFKFNVNENHQERLEMCFKEVPEHCRIF